MAEERSKPNAFVAVIRVLLWLGVIVAAGVSAFLTFTGIYLASGAPQEASAAAMGLALVVIPYVFARAFDEMTRGV